jgi:hypothetical protein
MEGKMGERSVEFKTSLSVKECAQRFQSAIRNGRGVSARIGGLTATLMGGQGLSFYTPENDSPFSAADDDPPTFSVGVAVPKAYGAHLHGTNVHMNVWERGSHRDVVLWAHHSLTGGAHADQLIRAVTAELDEKPAYRGSHSRA